MQQGLGIETQVVTAEQVAELAPAFVTDDFHLGAFEPESGYADPSATAAAFLVEARRLGTRVLPETAARGIVVESGRVRGVRTDRGRYSAPIVVNAAGAWAGPVGGMVGLELPLQTWRHDTAFLRRPASLAVGHPTVIDDVLSMYFRPETGGLTLVGLEDGNPLGRSPEEPTETPLPGFVTRAVDRICRRIPEMEKGSLHSSHGGFDGLTPDQRPILGPAGPEGFFLDCGFSGTGFKIAPAVGAAMAEWILDGYPSIADVTGFGLARFERGEHLHGENPYAAIWR
jgi:glycine/D-amino acid oxidase-like deaminating enzyme